MLAIGNKFNLVGSRSTYKGDFVELKTEGQDEMNVLCPVSKLTGFPLNMQSAIMLITADNERLASFLYQEIPAIRYDDAISDSDKLKTLVSRLDSGSFAENDKVAQILGDIVKEFFPAAEKEVVNQVVEQVQKSVSDAGSPNVTTT